MYEVIRYFEDLLDNSYPYEVGDTYPRVGLSPTQERIQELASDKNKQHTVLIKAVDAPETQQEENEEDEKPKSRRKRRSSEE